MPAPAHAGARGRVPYGLHLFRPSGWRGNVSKWSARPGVSRGVLPKRRAGALKISLPLRQKNNFSRKIFSSEVTKKTFDFAQGFFVFYNNIYPLNQLTK
jgi:hypothetical protein